MKKLFTILLIAFSFAASAQVFQSQSIYGVQYKRLKIDSTLHIPTFNGVPTLRGSIVGNQGAIALDSANQQLYFYNPKDSSWNVVAGGTGLDTLYTSSSLTTDTIIGVKDGNRFPVAVIDSKQGIIDGIQVSYVSDLTYHVTSGIAKIGTNRWNITGADVTLSPADPTYDRIDVIAIDSTGPIVIAGTPSVNPASPQLNGDQIQLVEVLVKAGATTPSGVSTSLIYDENTGSWTFSTSNLTGDANNTALPFHLTKDIYVSAGSSGGYFQLVNNTTLNSVDYTNLTFHLKLNSGLNNKSNISVQFFKGTADVSNGVFLSTGYGFNKSNTGYQTVTIPISAFNFSSSTFDRVRIIYTGNSFQTFYADYIQLQAGVPTAGTFTQIQTDYLQADPTQIDYIKNKPVIYTKSQIDSIAGLKADLSKVQSDSTILTNELNKKTDTVQNIASLQAYVGIANSLIVTDTLQGGIFYRSTTGTVDNGITFPANGGGYWVRKFDASLGANVDWWGFNPTEDSANIFAAINYAKFRGIGLNFSSRVYKFTPPSSGALYASNQADVTGIDITGIPFFHGTGTLDVSNLNDSLYSLFQINGSISLVDSVTLTANVNSFTLHTGLSLKPGDILFALSPNAYINNFGAIYKNGQRFIVDSYDASTGIVTIVGKVNYAAYYYLYVNSYMPKIEVARGLTFIARDTAFLCAFRTKFAEAHISGNYQNFGDATIQINASLAYINNCSINGIVGNKTGYAYGISSNDLSQVYVNDCNVTGGTALSSGGGGRVFFGFNIGNIGDSASYIFPTNMYIDGGTYMTSPSLVKGLGETISPHGNTNDFFLSNATVVGSLNTSAVRTIINNCNIFYSHNKALTVASFATRNADGFGDLYVQNTKFHSTTTSGNSFSAISTNGKFNSINISNVQVDGYFSGGNQPITILDSLNSLSIDGFKATVSTGTGNSCTIYQFTNDYKFNNINLNGCYFLITPQVSNLNLYVNNYNSEKSASYGFKANSSSSVPYNNVRINNSTLDSSTFSGASIGQSSNAFVNATNVTNNGSPGLVLSAVTNSQVSNSIVNNNGSYGIQLVNAVAGSTYSLFGNYISRNSVPYNFSTATPIYVQDSSSTKFGGDIYCLKSTVGATTDSILVKGTSDSKIKLIPASTFLTSSGASGSYVDLTSTQTITGAKTFPSSTKITPTSGTTVTFDNAGGMSLIDTVGGHGRFINIFSGTPSVVQYGISPISVDGGGVSFSFSTGGVGLHYYEKTKLWDNGIYATFHSGAGNSTITYQYFGTGSDATYTNNNIRLYPDKTVGLMTVNTVIGNDILTRNNSSGLVTREVQNTAFNKTYSASTIDSSNTDVLNSGQFKRDMVSGNVYGLTQATTDSSKKIATTEFVKKALYADSLNVVAKSPLEWKGDTLTIKDSAMAVWSGGGGIDSTTASNGITLSGKDVQLGGRLTSNTIISNNGHWLKLIDSTGTVTPLYITATTDAVHVQSNNGLAIQAFSLGGKVVDMNSFVASTNTIIPVMSITRSSTGTTANGVGASLDMMLQNSGNAATVTNQIISKLTNASSAAYTSQLQITGVNNKVIDTLISLNGDGSAKFNQYGLGTFTGAPSHSLQVDANGNIIEGSVVSSTGTATLSSGTVTISSTLVKSTSKIFVTVNTPSGTQGFISVPTASIIAGTSFVINSSSAADNSTVNWMIIN